jgi:outer membrane protein OmpA-like peptidoglycan-associated protein
MKSMLLFIAIGWSIVSAAQSPQAYSVYFATDKHEVSPAEKEGLAAWIRQRPELSVIELHGFCDSRGAELYNEALSDRRVAAIKDLLLGYGIPPASIILAEGHGEKLTQSGNDTEEGRQQNRRVEIRLQRTDAAIDKAAIPTPKTDPPKQSITETFADTTVTAGSKIVLPNINFRGGMHQILPGTYVILDELLSALQQNPNLVIEIQGHICCQPGEADGMDIETGEQNLSEARAKAIHDYLIGKGIEQRRLSYKGLGHSKPIFPYPEQSEGEQIANRRVEIKIISR